MFNKDAITSFFFFKLILIKFSFKKEMTAFYWIAFEKQ